MLPHPVGYEANERVRSQKGALTYQQLKPVIISTDMGLKVEEVRVDMADMKVESKPVELLTSVGSCIAICMYDSVHRCGGLAHVMLPISAKGTHEPLPPKFADTAVPALAKEIRQLAGAETRLTAKIAGGANMFANLAVNALDIGNKNAIAVKNALVQHKISLTGEDVGGSHGRRVKFNVTSGVTVVRSHNGELKIL